MSSIQPVPSPRSEHSLHDRAMEDLRFIRTTMERAGGFTVVPGWGQVAIGVTALIAAAVAATQSTSGGWLAVWSIEAAVALAIGVWAMMRKAAAAEIRLIAAARKLALGFLPPIVAGALLTAFLYQAGMVTALPGLWLLLFGVSIAAVGTYSVRIVPAMGLCFMMLGALALFAPASWSNALMAIGFGGVQIFFGIRIARRHGG